MVQRNIRLEISYNGSGYRGWQKQKNAPSIQAELEKAASRVFREPIRSTGIGRTDAGAHAFRYTANFKTTNKTIPVSKISRLLNRKLPEAVSVTGASEVPDSFHARYSALAREYVYFLVNGYRAEKTPPLYRELAYFSPDRYDAQKVANACSLFHGEHDFRNFCSAYGEGMDYKRKIHYFRVREMKILGTPVLVFFIKGNGFLKGMIRTLVSACLNHAGGNLTAEKIKNALKPGPMLEPKFRVPVPACGLYFKRGYYQ